jgi:hypothetical protein
MKMRQAELRELIHNAIQRPVRICMDDGKSYVVSHPDFALVAQEAIVLSSGPGHEFGAGFVICWFDHISRVEIKDKPKSKAKA